MHPEADNENPKVSKRLSIGPMSEKSNPYISDKKTSIKEKLRITLKGSDAKLSSQKTGKITEMDEN